LPIISHVMHMNCASSVNLQAVGWTFTSFQSWWRGLDSFKLESRCL